MRLPIELIMLILKSLEKYKLKDARLVSRAWNPMAAELLFDQVYVSAHPKNLEVFNAIARHPLLSKCVKTLRYDAVDFVGPCTKRQYFWSLWFQIQEQFWESGELKLKGSTPYTKIDTLVKLIASFGDHFNRVACLEIGWSICKDYDFISQGHQKYQVFGALQRAHLNDGRFLESLVSGLQTLSNLSSVMIDGDWSFPKEFLHDPQKLFLRRPTGSPLAREWNVFHTCPEPWQFVPSQYPRGTILRNGAENGADHYWTIIAALLRSQRKIQVFILGNQCNSFPPFVFDRARKKNLSFYGLDTVAFSDLKYLQLSIAEFGSEKTSEHFPNINGLGLLMRSMHHLRGLALYLPAYLKDEVAFYNSGQVFPQEGQWNQLTSLSLHGLSSSAAGFLTLITRQMPALNRLLLGVTQLDIGNWEGVIECMRHSMHLSIFNILPKTQFYHRGATKFFDYGQHCPKRKEIGKYVMSGGRHPCLRPNQPNSTAALWVTPDIQDFYMPIPPHTLLASLSL